MPVTLAQAKLNTVDPVDINIIDEFEKSNDILTRITFDDVVSAVGGGAALSYGYMRQVTQRGAAFRAINSEYVPVEATKQRFNVDLKPIGGSFQIDRILDRAAAARETAFQMRELLKASSAHFSDQVVNGDSAVDANGFDGLNKILTGSTTEYLPLANGTATGFLDWTTIDSKAKALAAARVIDDWLALMDGQPDVIYGNRRAISQFKALAAWADLFTGAADSFGRPVVAYAGIPLVDLKTKAGSNTDVQALVSRDTDGAGAGTAVTGLADLYAVRFGLDGFHGVSMAGGPLVRSWDPDFSTAGAVKTGEAELGPAAPVLKRTRAAAVLRNIKVAA